MVEPGPDRRVDPLVEVELVAGVEEDAEERVAEAAVDDRLERPAGLADVERAVPLGHGREVRPDEPLDVVADPVGQLGRVLDDEARPAGEGAPDPERRREPVAALDAPVAGTEQAEAWRAARAVSIRWHDSGAPFQLEQADGLALASCPARSPTSSSRTPCEVWHDAYSKAASWSTSLMTRSPSAASISRSFGVLDRPVGADEPRAARRR